MVCEIDGIGEAMLHLVILIKLSTNQITLYNVEEEIVKNLIKKFQIGSRLEFSSHWIKDSMKILRM